MTTSVEVIICTFNGEKFVIEQLQSILRQTTPPDRISIFDDKSTDATVPQTEVYISQQTVPDQQRFALKVNDQNLGYAENFISAITQSSADVIFLCDQDDLWEPNKIEILLETLERSGADMAFSDGFLIDQDGKPLARNQTVLGSYGLTPQMIGRFRNEGFGYLMKRNYINGAAVAVRRSAAQAALPLPCDMPHDYWLALWCSLHGGVVATPKLLYRYRQHGANVIGMGSDRLLYVWLGIWRQPVVPRRRELSIWEAVTARIAQLPQPYQVSAAQGKLAWLARVVGQPQRSFSRILAIVASSVCGDYRRYSPPHALLRDLVSLIK